jgi:hypothetical protein
MDEAREDVRLSLLGDPEKAKSVLDALFDYICELIDNIMRRYPAVMLPLVEKMTMRDEADVNELLKSPLYDGKYFYTVA